MLKKRFISMACVIAMTLMVMCVSCYADASADMQGLKEQYLTQAKYYTDTTVQALRDATEDETIQAAIAGLEHAEPYYTLTGNGWDETAKAAYSQWGLDLPDDSLKAASYHWASDSQLDGDQVEDVTKLTDGVFSNAVFGAWNGQQGTAIFSFDQGYVIDRVDIVQLQDGANGVNQGIGAVRVLALEDGEYQQIASGTMSQDNKYTDVGMNKTYAVLSLTFPMHRADKIKIEIEKTNWQLVAAEVGIFGCEEFITPAEKTLAKAEKYLEAKGYYSSETVAALESAVENLKKNDGTSGETTEQYVQAVENAIVALRYAEPYYTLTGNGWDETAKAAYSQWGLDLPNDSLKAASYHWASDSQLDGDQMEDVTKLTDGVFSNAVFGAWNGQQGTAIFSFDQGYVIDRVDIVQLQDGANGVNQGIGAVRVSALENGEYQQIASGTMSQDNRYTDVGMNKTYAVLSLTFPMHRADKIKIEIEKTNWQLVAAEVGIFGCKAATQEIEQAIADAEPYIQLEKFYTPDSMETLKKAVEAGRKLTDASGKEELHAAAENIRMALNGLALKDLVLKRAGILTNNLMNEADKGLYPGLTSVNTGLSYSYEGDDRANFENSDGDHSKLMDGLKYADGSFKDEGINGVFGTWAGPNSVSIIVDAQEEVYFTGADIWEQCQSIAYIGSVTVSVKGAESEDEYQQIASYTSDYTVTGGAEYHQIGGDFAPVKGRYLKYDIVRRSDAYQMVPWEIVVKGFLIPAALAEFGTTDYTVLDSQGGSIANGLTGADFIYASGVLTNDTTDEITGYVLTAVYDNNNCLIAAVRSQEVTVRSGEIEAWNNELDQLGGLKSGARLVNYFWSDHMTPLAIGQIKQ